MSKEWLAAANYERTQGLISAINVLAIHTKLALAGISDAQTAADAADARERLEPFLQNLGSLVGSAESAPFSPLPGADPRLRSLAGRFLHARQGGPSRSVLFALAPEESARLLTSEDRDDREHLLSCLRSLRGMLEEQAHTDRTGILGEL